MCNSFALARENDDNDDLTSSNCEFCDYPTLFILCCRAQLLRTKERACSCNNIERDDFV